MNKPTNHDENSLEQLVDKLRNPYQAPKVTLLEMSEVHGGDQHLQEVDGGGWVS